MNRIDVGQLIQIVANIGVIAGIVFLGIEISQNNELMEAQARFNRLTIQTGSQTIIAENAQLAEIVSKSEAGLQLTPAEQVQYDALYGRALSNIYWSYSELPESELPISAYRAVLGRPGVQEIWQRAKSDFSAEFVSFIEDEVLSVDQ